MDPDTNAIRSIPTLSDRYQHRPGNTDAVFTRFLVQAIFAVLLYILPRLAKLASTACFSVFV